MHSKAKGLAKIHNYLAFGEEQSSPLLIYMEKKEMIKNIVVVKGGTT
jgi:hypothetical protein